MSEHTALDAGLVAGAIAHMNDDHADAVIDITRHFGGRPDVVTAVMTGLDRTTMEVRAAAAGEAPSALTVRLSRSIGSAGDVRAVLVEMARAARAESSRMGFTCCGGIGDSFSMWTASRMHETRYSFFFSGASAGTERSV